VLGLLAIGVAAAAVVCWKLWGRREIKIEIEDFVLTQGELPRGWGVLDRGPFMADLRRQMGGGNPGAIPEEGLEEIAREISVRPKAGYAVVYATNEDQSGPIVCFLSLDLAPQDTGPALKEILEEAENDETAFVLLCPEKDIIVRIFVREGSLVSAERRKYFDCIERFRQRLGLKKERGPNR